MPKTKIGEMEMVLRLLVTVSTVLLMLSTQVLAAGKPTDVASPAPVDVVSMIKNGGYVIYLRHTKTNRSQKDQNHRDLSDCATQRNLSDEGRQQAKTIGQVFTTNSIPVDKVLSSPYCRAKETSDIAFGSHQVDDSLFYLSGALPEEKPGIIAGVKKLLGTAPVAGKNTVLVSHTSNLKEGAGIWPKESGVAVIFKPAGGSFKAVGKIEPDEWAALAK
jgi:phosphohistidine phosphatase SixA